MRRFLPTNRRRNPNKGTSLKAHRKAARGRIDYGWFILSSSFLAVFLVNGFRMSFGVFLKPMVAEFHWSRAVISLAVGVNTVLYGLLQPVAGRFADRYGTRNIIMAGLSVIGLAAILLYFTPGLSYFYLVYGGLLALGFTCSSLVIQTTLVSRWFARRRGLALGIVSSGASAGQFILIPLSVFLIGSVGWRGADLVFGLLVLALALPFAFLVIRDAPAEAQRPQAERSAVARSGRPGPLAPPPAEVLPLRAVLRTSPFLLLAASFFVCGYTTGLVSTHLAAYATDLGFSAADAAGLLAVMGGMNIFGTLSMGALSDKTGRKRPLALMYFLRGLAFLAIVFSRNLTVLYGFSIFMGFSYFATVPLTSGMTGDIYGARNVGTLFGLIFLCHQVGSSLSAFLGGVIYDLTGTYHLAFLSAAFLALAASVASSLIQEDARFLPVRIPQEGF